jgi:SAM-dependent methyltransferase
MVNKKEVATIILEYHKSVISHFPQYKKHYPSTRDISADSQYRFEELNTILRYFTMPSPAKILDVGTGYGQVLYYFYKKGNEVYGIEDDSGGTVSDGNEGEYFPFAEKRYCSLEKGDFGYAENTFDLVTCLNTIEHMPCSPKELLKEIHRVLKNGGFAYISSPNVAVLGKRISFLIKGKSPYWDIKDYFDIEPESFGSHYREYTLRELQYMAKSVGFGMIASGYYDLEYYRWIAGSYQGNVIRRMIERLLFRPLRIAFSPLRSSTFVVVRK